MFHVDNKPLVMIRTGFIRMKTKVSIVLMAFYTSTLSFNRANLLGENQTPISQSLVFYQILILSITSSGFALNTGYSKPLSFTFSPLYVKPILGEIFSPSGLTANSRLFP